MSSRLESIQENLKKIKQTLPDSVKLIAVSKTYPSSDILFAYQCGQRDFGENKIQELFEKSHELRESCPEIRWHQIGPVQSNKINLLSKVPNLYAIHSIDSEKLLLKLIEKIQGVKFFLQINTSDESQKHGFHLNDDLKKIVTEHAIFGLMTMAGIRGESKEQMARESFRKLLSLRNELSPELQLSMGMSGDYKIALEYETHYVRIGSSIFGSRNEI